jgi:hypothetical protein
MSKADAAKLKLCEGCRNNFYNQSGNSNTGRCWSFDNAKVVTRYRIGWWTQPTSPTAYTKVKTLDCHHAPGQYALHEELPACFPGKSRVENEEPMNA